MNVYTNQVNIFFYDMFFILFSRNNGYAISTPADEQYRGDGLGKKKKKNSLFWLHYVNIQFGAQWARGHKIQGIFGRRDVTKGVEGAPIKSKLSLNQRYVLRFNLTTIFLFLRINFRGWRNFGCYQVYLTYRKCQN